MVFELFWKGIITGLLVSIPLGPIGVLCIQRTLNKGKKSGFVSGLGAATADTLFAIIASFGISIIIRFVREQHIYFQLIGGVIVLLLGISVFYANPVKQLRMQRMNRNRLSQDFFSVFLLTISNPMAIFFLLAILAGINAASGPMNLIRMVSLVLGVFLGASAWWFMLSSFVNFWRGHFRLRIIWWLNKVAGVVIFSLGVITVLSIWFI